MRVTPAPQLVHRIQISTTTATTLSGDMAAARLRLTTSRVAGRATIGMARPARVPTTTAHGPPCIASDTLAARSALLDNIRQLEVHAAVTTATLGNLSRQLVRHLVFHALLASIPVTTVRRPASLVPVVDTAPVVLSRPPAAARVPLVAMAQVPMQKDLSSRRGTQMVWWRTILLLRRIRRRQLSRGPASLDAPAQLTQAPMRRSLGNTICTRTPLAAVTVTPTESFCLTLSRRQEQTLTT